jgi:hypothetical protein
LGQSIQFGTNQGRSAKLAGRGWTFFPTRIDFALIRGMALAEVIEVVAKIEGGQDVDLESDTDGGQGETLVGEAVADEG